MPSPSLGQYLRDGPHALADALSTDIIRDPTGAIQVISGGAVQLTVGAAGVLLGTGGQNATALLTLAKTYAGVGNGAVMADFVMDSLSTGGADQGALRAVARQTVSGSAFVRAIEAHALRDGAAATNYTWAIEVGVHSSVAGDGATRNIGIYLASSHTGWTATGVRNDVGLLITGEDGWTHGIRYLDVDGTTLLFDVNQNGLVRALGLTMATGDVTLTAGSIRVNGAGQIIDFSAAATGTLRGGSTSLVVQKNDGTANTLVVGNDGVTNLAPTTATPAGGSTAARATLGTTASFGVYYGSGAPTVGAAKGSLYLRSDGSGTANRAYINTDGGTTWTALTTAA